MLRLFLPGFRLIALLSIACTTVAVLLVSPATPIDAEASPAPTAMLDASEYYFYSNASRWAVYSSDAHCERHNDVCDLLLEKKHCGHSLYVNPGTNRHAERNAPVTVRYRDGGDPFCTAE